MNHLINNTTDLSELLTAHEVDVFDFTPDYPCIVVIKGNEAVACIAKGDFYPEQSDVINDLITSLNWHDHTFDLTNPGELSKLIRCQRFLSENLDALGKIRGEALKLKISLEHRRQRVRASIKLAKRAEGETATDAEAYARTMTEVIDEDHANSAAAYEEIRGLYDRLNSALIAISQDRKAMETQASRVQSLSTY